jgi:hypothetical protein
VALWYAATASIPDGVWGTIAHLDVLGMKPTTTGSQGSGQSAREPHVVRPRLPAGRTIGRRSLHLFRERRASHLQNVAETLDKRKTGNARNVSRYPNVEHSDQ